MTAANGARPRLTCIPYMSDHAYALAAAMRHYGMPARVLPPSDDRSMALGLSACGGRECLPCFLAIGDILRHCEAPDFVPADTAFCLPTTEGPCRFGQYSMLLRDTLDELGLDDVVVYAPNGANSYHGFGDKPLRIRRLAWKGVVAVDLLYRMLLERRPYENEPGCAEEAYRRGLDRCMRAVEVGGGPLADALKAATDDFLAVPVVDEERPVVGLVGEVYVRWNAHSNRRLIADVERLGGEVMIASMVEVLHFFNLRMKNVSRAAGRWGALIRAVLTAADQSRTERKLVRAVAHALRRPDEAPSREMAAAVAPFYDAAIGTEAVLSMGRAIEMAHMGVHGILNVMPFSCMPGVIVSGMAPRIRRELDWVPWLDLPYDAQRETNIRTRLEAFMHQAEQFRRRMGHEPVRGPTRAVGAG